MDPKYDKAPIATQPPPNRLTRLGERRKFGIRTFISVLIFASFLPGFLAGGLVLLKFRDSVEKAAETLMLEAVRALSTAIDQDIGTIAGELRIIAVSEPMQRGDLAAVRERASELAKAMQESSVTLWDSNEQLLFTTPMTPDARSTLPRDRGGNTRSAGETTGQDAWVEVDPTSSSSHRIVTARVPVLDRGEIRFFLEIKMPAERFATAFGTVALPEGWVAVIVDAHGTIVMRRPQPESAREKSDFVSRLGQSSEGTYTAADFDGVPMDGALTRSKVSGWSVAIGVPVQTFDAPFYRSLEVLAAIAALGSMLGMALAVLVSRRVAGSVRSLWRAAETMGWGGQPRKPEGGIREIERVSAALLDAARTARARAAERDHALAALNEANELLEHRVRARTQELDEANRQLVQEIEHRRKAEEALIQKSKLEAIGRLTAGVAHDFNNLLTVVIGNIGLLARRLTDEVSARLAQRALMAARSGVALNKQLLVFSRRQRLETSIVDLNEFLTRAMPLFRDASGPMIDVDVRLAETAGAVTIDRAQMELALVNLAANARDAMPKGGRIVVETRSLSASAEHQHVPRGEWGVISISDTGTGMSPDVVARAFEPFFTTKSVGAGTGLGLSMVYGLVKQLGGEIAIESEPGRGTSVEIYLPRTLVTALRQAKPPRSPAVGTATGTVLLVDDDPEVRMVMADSLKEAGHRVVEAGSGLAALDLFGEGTAFEIAVIDYAMPGMTGANLIREMLRRRPNFTTLLVTGFAEVEELDRLPAQQILYKPFSPDQLVRRVAELLEHPTPN